MSTAMTVQAPLDLWDPNTFEHAQRIGRMFASSVLIPEHLRGKLPDVTIALMMARRLGEDPLVVMQNIFVVGGRAGWSAQYVIARANRSGVFRGRINWRETGSGDDLAIEAYATLAETGEVVAFTASMRMAKDEGWTRNPKYESMPQLMLRYRSAVLLVRLYAPEVMLGVPTVEEVEDTQAAAPPQRIQVAAANVPALEDAGTRGAQLAAILDADEEPPAPIAAEIDRIAEQVRQVAPVEDEPEGTPEELRVKGLLDEIAELERTLGHVGRGRLGIRRIGTRTPPQKLEELLRTLQEIDAERKAAALNGDRWTALEGDELAGAVADVMERLGDTASLKALHDAGLTEDTLDNGTDDDLRIAGRALERHEVGA